MNTMTFKKNKFTDKNEDRGLFFICRYFIILFLDILILSSLVLLTVSIVLLTIRQVKLLPEIFSAITGLFSMFGVWCVYYLLMFRKAGKTVAMRFLGTRVDPIEGDSLSWCAALTWGIMYSNPVTSVLSFCFILFRSRLTLVERWTDTILVDSEQR